MERKRNRLIAIVDDDLVFATAVAEWLRIRGLEVIIISGGIELISALGIDRPDLLIIDNMLSWIDPHKLIESLRSNPYLKDIEVILMTERRDILEDRDEYNTLCLSKVMSRETLYRRLFEEITGNEIA